MPLHALLETTSLPLLALIPTTLDRVAVWAALALMMGLIAWRQYTLPEISPAFREPDAGTSAGGTGALASADMSPGPGVPRSEV